MQVLNVGRIKFGDTRLISPTAKFSSMPLLLAIQYLRHCKTHNSSTHIITWYNLQHNSYIVVIHNIDHWASKACNIDINQNVTQPS